MSTLPVFRRMVKAIGDHLDPKRTAYRYEIVEFWPDGKFVRRPAVYINDTQMRADGDRAYEMGTGWDWSLISADEFHELKLAWDRHRQTLGYSAVDEMGAMEQEESQDRRGIDGNLA